MAPLSKIKCDGENSKSHLKGVQNPSIKGRSKQHEITLNVEKQVMKKVEDLEKALIMTEVNSEEIKIITNSGNFKVLSEELKKLQPGEDIKCEVSIAKVTDTHTQTDKNGVPFVIKTEFSVKDVATDFQQKAVVHTYLTKSFFMIQGKGKMHDKSFCRDYFHLNIMQPFINKIMETKGQEIVFMNQMLKGLNNKDNKRKQPERFEKCNICGRMLQNIKGLGLHKKRMHALDIKKGSPC